MNEALVAGLLAGYGVAVPVGAIGALLVTLTARTSLRVGAAAALGVATADLLYALAAVLGGAALAALIQPFSTTMRWTAALILTGVAARTAHTAWRRHRHRTAATDALPDTRPTTPLRAYLALLGLTMLNPATIVYFAALVLGRESTHGDGPVPDAVFVAAAFAASASWQLLLASGGNVLGRVLTGPRGRLGTSLVSSLVIVILAVALVLP